MYIFKFLHIGHLHDFNSPYNFQLLAHFSTHFHWVIVRIIEISKSCPFWSIDLFYHLLSWHRRTSILQSIKPFLLYFIGWITPVLWGAVALSFWRQRATGEAFVRKVKPCVNVGHLDFSSYLSCLCTS